MTGTAQPVTSTATPWIRAYQGFSILVALEVLWQFVTAGQLFPQGGPGALHAGGAIVLHVLSGLAVVSAFLLWRTGVLTVAGLALPVVVFALTFVQAALGGYDSLAYHIPGAMILTSGVIWQLVTALRLRRR
jgi:hypothetical protein